MNLRNGDTPFRLPGSDSPLKKSTSVMAIIHGGSDAPPNSNHYIDSLERFHRDFASVDKQERDNKKQKEEISLGRRRNHTIQREQSLRKLEEYNVQKMRDRQALSLELHKKGAKLTIHSHGVAIDPVNLRYENNEHGRMQQSRDHQKTINNMVRSHKLQTFGSSGYNIINGQRSLRVEQMVPSQNYGQFQQKLGSYYEKFRIKLDH